MFAAQIVGFGLLLLLLELLLALLLFLSLPKFVGGGLLGGDVLVLDIGVVVFPPTRRTAAIKVGLDIMIAELADLVGRVSIVMAEVGGA